MVRNTEFHDAFTTFREKGIRTRVLKQALQDRNIAIPKNSTNTFMCLSWHVKGIAMRAAILAKIIEFTLLPNTLPW
jgi:hypothetical protein